MSKYILYILLILFFTVQKIGCLTKKVNQLHTTLNNLSQRLSSAPKTMSYQELVDAVKVIKEKKDISILDPYQKTPLITTAQYLIQELKKNVLQFDEQKINEIYDYVPFISLLAEKISNRYPNFNKNESFNAVSIASRDLDKELFIILMLRHLGYKKIFLTAIDTAYVRYSENDFTIGKAVNQIKTWLDKYTIKKQVMTADDQSKLIIEKETDVCVLLRQKSSWYIHDLKEKKYPYPKNHLFVTIQPGGHNITEFSKKDALLELPDILKVGANLFTLKTLDNSKKIEVYLPYEQNDIFVRSFGMESVNDKKYVTKIEKYVIEHNYYSPGRYYSDLMRAIINNFYEKLDNEVKLKECSIFSDVDISLIDLVQHTAVDPKNTLAFKTLFLGVREMNDFSGSFKDTYLRYFEED